MEVREARQVWGAVDTQELLSCSAAVVNDRLAVVFTIPEFIPDGKEEGQGSLWEGQEGSPWTSQSNFLSLGQLGAWSS